VRRWWRQGEAFNFGIFDRREDRFLGSIWLSQINQKHHYANVGYWVRTRSTGRGIATAAVKLILQFGFEEAGMNRLEILAAVGNKASRAVARKIGAKPEGVLRHRLQLQNRFHDAVMFSVLKKDRTPSGTRRRNVSAHRKGPGASSPIGRLNSGP
ncbi:MAG TPA: GNAT family protein, partial [Candidatus Nitrosotalea sp.]|nr:GNAT family protein [Candidatus Nitrosotalea sp.]